MKYLLDTNTCIRYINGCAPQIRERMRRELDSDIAISTVSMGEMFYGSAKSANPSLSRAKQDAFFVRFTHLVYDFAAADEFGRIRTYLEKAGTPIGPYDMQITAVAVANGLVVVTHNTAEFKRISWLKIEDWEV
jgi:tRNA(fMet)-specific endonuclease VapC